MIWRIGQYSLIQTGRCPNLLDVSVDCIKSATKSRHVSLWGNGTGLCLVLLCQTFSMVTIVPLARGQDGQGTERKHGHTSQECIPSYLNKSQTTPLNFWHFLWPVQFRSLLFLWHTRRLLVGTGDNFSDCSPLPVFRSPYSEESKLTKKRLSWNLWHSTSCSHSWSVNSSTTQDLANELDLSKLVQACLHHTSITRPIVFPGIGLIC